MDLFKRRKEYVEGIGVSNEVLLARKESFMDGIYFKDVPRKKMAGTSKEDKENRCK